MLLSGLLWILTVRCSHPDEESLMAGKQCGVGLTTVLVGIFQRPVCIASSYHHTFKILMLSARSRIKCQRGCVSPA